MADERDDAPTAASIVGDPALDRATAILDDGDERPSPDGRGPYGTVDVWVHQGSGGMAKMEGWDKLGNLIRTYKIASVQKVGKAHIPEEMRIESKDPKTGKRSGLTYMTFDKPDVK